MPLKSPSVHPFDADGISVRSRGDKKSVRSQVEERPKTAPYITNPVKDRTPSRRMTQVAGLGDPPLRQSPVELDGRSIMSQGEKLWRIRENIHGVENYTPAPQGQF